MQNNDKYKVVINEEFFYLIFSIWSIGEIVFNTTADTIFGVDVRLINESMNWIVFCMLMIQIIFFQKYELKSGMIIVLVTVFFVIAVVLSKSLFILSTWMFIVASMHIDFEQIIRIEKRVLSIGISVVVLLRFAGVLEDFVMSRAGANRYSLGFVHPNQLGLRVFQLVLCIVYLDRNRINIKDYIIVAASSFFCFKIPNSQTATICLILLFFLMSVYRLFELKEWEKKTLFGSALVAGAALTNVLSITFSLIDVKKNRLLSWIDLALSIRFSAGHKVYELYGISILGNRIYVTDRERELVGIGYNLWLDNSYLYLLLRYGVISYGIYSMLYLIGMRYYKDAEEYFMVIIFFLYSVYGIMETGLFMIQHNVFLLALGAVVFLKGHDSTARVSI